MNRFRCGIEMSPWPKHPVIYEINAWVWLQELSREPNSPVTLDKVPRETWDSIADLRVDAVWFMGVWERSPAGIAVIHHPESFRKESGRKDHEFSLSSPGSRA